MDVLLVVALTASLLGAALTPEGSPSPAASSSPCAVARQDSKATLKMQPDYPEGARQHNETGVVAIVVKLTNEGYVSAAEVTKSSHHGALDAEALRAAVSSRYSPAIVNCVPVAGSYTFVSEFDSQ